MVVVAPLLAMSVQADQVEPPSVLWRTWYLVMFAFEGSVQLSLTWASPGVALSPVGAAGAPGPVWPYRANRVAPPDGLPKAAVLSWALRDAPLVMLQPVSPSESSWWFPALPSVKVLVASPWSQTRA